MPQLTVIVPKLNKRRIIPSQLPDKGNIVGEVKQGFTFEGVEEINVPNALLGKWYKDRDGHFYWGGGLMEEAQPLAPAILNERDWGFIDFKIDQLWKHSKGEGIRVAILDSGLDYRLSDFANLSNIDFYNAVKKTSNKEDCLDDKTGHGTDCAAILCGQGKSLQGVAPEIKLSVIKITNDNGERSLSAVLNGLDHAIEIQADVISLSFTISRTDQNAAQLDEMHSLIKKAYQADCTLVASAGDSGGLDFPVDDFPASFPECLSIGGVTRNRRRAATSTKSTFLDLMGPGDDLHSVTTPSRPISGTSFATPFVAGVVALLKSTARNQNKPLPNIELFDLLKRSADKTVPGYSILDYGWGILDPVAAANLLHPKNV